MQGRRARRSQANLAAFYESILSSCGFLYLKEEGTRTTLVLVQRNICVCVCVCFIFTLPPMHLSKSHLLLLFLRCQITCEGFNLGIFFLSLFSFTSFLFFSFLFWFCFFETEILVARADLGTEYVVDSDVEFLIFPLPPLKCWKFRHTPPHPMYIDR